MALVRLDSDDARPPVLYTCGNCGRAIGALEQPYQWGDAIVCTQCCDKLQQPTPAPTAPFTRRRKPAAKSKLPLTIAVTFLILILGGFYFIQRQGFVVNPIAEPTYLGKPMSEWIRLTADNDMATREHAFKALAEIPSCPDLVFEKALNDTSRPGELYICAYALLKKGRDPQSLLGPVQACLNANGLERWSDLAVVASHLKDKARPLVPILKTIGHDPGKRIEVEIILRDIDPALASEPPELRLPPLPELPPEIQTPAVKPPPGEPELPIRTTTRNPPAPAPELPSVVDKLETPNDPTTSPRQPRSMYSRNAASLPAERASPDGARPFDPVIEYSLAKQRLAEAKTEAEDAKSECIAKLYASAAYRAALADRDAKELQLTRARKSGTPQERIDASSAFNKARAALEKMEADELKNNTRLQIRNEVLAEKEAGVAAAMVKMEGAARNIGLQEEAAAARAAYELRHRPFLERQHELGRILDQMNDRAVSPEEKADPYVAYRRKTELVVKALRATFSYKDEDESAIDSDEYGKLLTDAARIGLAWNQLCTSQERQYPSSVLLLKILPQLASQMGAFKILDTVRKSSKKDEQNNAPIEVQVSNSRALLAMGISEATSEKRMNDDLDAVLSTLRSREGTRPILPPPPPVTPLPPSPATPTPAHESATSKPAATAKPKLFDDP